MSDIFAESARKAIEAGERLLALRDGITHLTESVDDFMARTSLPPLYSHRNGETEPPSESGYYWFDGFVIMSSGNRLRVRDMLEPEQEPRDRTYEGQWWGPVTSPWEQEV